MKLWKRRRVPYWLSFRERWFGIDFEPVVPGLVLLMALVILLLTET